MVTVLILKLVNNFVTSLALSVLQGTCPSMDTLHLHAGRAGAVFWRLLFVPLEPLSILLHSTWQAQLVHCTNLNLACPQAILESH